MSDKTSYSRRQVIRNASVAATTLGFVGTSAARRRAHSNFNPNDEEQLSEFLDELRSLSTEERQKRINQLTEEEFLAVQEALYPDNFRVESEQVDAQSSGPPHTVSVVASSTTGADLWTLYHRIDWDSYTYPVNSRAWLTVHDALYDGNGISDSKSWVDGYEARKVGVVKGLANVEYKGVSVEFKMTPVVHLQGHRSGGYSVIEKDDGQ